MTEARIRCVWTILIPRLVEVEQGRLSPPVAPRHPVVAVSEQGPFPDTLEERPQIEAFPLCTEVKAVRIPRCRIAQIDHITILTWGVAVQADLAVPVHVLESRVANPDVAGHARDQLVRIELRLCTDQPIEHVPEVRVDGIAFPDLAVSNVVQAQHVRVLSAIVDDSVLGVAEQRARADLHAVNVPFPSHGRFKPPGLELTRIREWRRGAHQ